MGQDATETADLPPVVTIFEQYGAGADEVGRAVADALGVPFHAQAFASEELEGAASTATATATEQGAVLARVYGVLGGAYGGLEGRDVATTQREKHDLVIANNDAVWEMADRGGVIVGRNGAVVLAQRPRTVHVLLTGAVEDRVERAARAAGIPRERAAARQRVEDRVRAEMSLALYGWDPRLPDRYDLVVNTSRIPLERAVSTIVHTARGEPA
ncbi:cytidylate kinase-like family protein [Cellulomonas sp. NPDC055163]